MRERIVSENIVCVLCIIKFIILGTLCVLKLIYVVYEKRCSNFAAVPMVRVTKPQAGQEPSPL